MTVEILEGVEENSYWMDLHASNRDLGQYERPGCRFYGRWSNNGRLP